MPTKWEEAKEQAEQCHKSDPAAAELPLQTSPVALSTRQCVAEPGDHPCGVDSGPHSVLVLAFEIRSALLSSA